MDSRIIPNDIPFKSTYKLAGNSLQNVKCVLNGTIFSSKGGKYDYYYCPKCNMDYICSQCFQTCHKGHGGENKKRGETTIADNLCGCGVKYHQTKPGKSKDDDCNHSEKGDDSKMSGCPCNEELLKLFLENSDESYAYIHKYNKTPILCKYCFDKCILSGEKQFYEIVKKKDLEEGQKIECQCKSIHASELSNMFHHISAFIKEHLSLSGKYILLTNHNFSENQIFPFLKINSMILKLKKDKEKFSYDPPRPSSEIKEQFGLFEKLIDELVVTGINVDSKNALLDQFKIDVISYLLQQSYSDVSFFTELQLFYLKMCRKVIVKPQFYNYLEDRSNISPLHRLMFQVQGSKEEKDQEDLLNKLKEKILSEDLKKNFPMQFAQLMKEYFKFVKLYIIQCKNDPQKLETIFRNYIAEIAKKFDSSNGFTIDFNKRIQKLCQLIYIYKNDCYFYKTYFEDPKKSEAIGFEEIKQKGEENTSEQKKIEFFFSFENNNFNRDVLMTIFNKSKKPCDDSTLNSKGLFDNLINEDDCYISSLEQVKNYPGLDKLFKNELQSLIDGKTDSNFLPLTVEKKREYEVLKKQFEDKDIELIQSFHQSDSARYVFKFQQMLEEAKKFIEAFINEEELKTEFQIVFVASYHFSRFIRYIKLCNFLLTINPEKTDTIISIKKEIYELILLVLQNNPFLVSMFFNIKMYKVFFSFDKDAISFYISLMKILKKSDYKINTLSFMNFISNPTYTKIKEKEIIISLIKLYKVILSVTHEKTYAPVNQKICEELFKIERDKKINSIIENYEKLFQNERNVKSKAGEEYRPSSKLKSVEDLPLLIAFISCMNKIDNSFFGLIKKVISIKKVLFLIDKKAIEQFDEWSIMQNLKFRKHLLLFVSKYEFLSLYDWNFSNLFSLAKRKLEPGMYEPIIDNLIHFPIFTQKINFDKDEEVIELFSYLKNAIAIPIYLLTWKVVYYYLMTIKENYFIYKIVYLFYECLNHVFTLAENSHLIREDIKAEEMFKKFFGEGFNFANVKQTIEDSLKEIKGQNLKEIKGENFEFVNLDKSFPMLETALKLFKFFIEENPPEKEEENNVQLRRNDSKNRIRENFNYFINNYKSTKETNNLLIDLFDDEKENDSNTEEKESNQYDEYVNRIISELLSLVKHYDNKEFEENGAFNDSTVTLSKINFYDYSFYESITVITKLFKKNPRLWQDSLTNPLNTLNAKLGSKIIDYLLKFQIYIFGQITLYQPLSVLGSTDMHCKLLIQNLEFLRLLCEDHNPIFQTFLIQAENILMFDACAPSIPLVFVFTLSREIVKIFIHSKSQEKYVEKLSNKKKFNMLIDLENQLTDFRIEIIQGTTKNNLEFIGGGKNEFFENYFNIYLKLLDELDEKNESIAELNASFLKFLNCFVEENSIYIDVYNKEKKDAFSFISKINTKKLILNGENAFELLLKKFDIELRNNKNVDKFKDIIEHFHSYYSTIEEDPYFIIAFNIFFFINQIADLKIKCSAGYKQLLNELAEEQTNESSKYNSTVNKEYYDFCSNIIMKNDVMFTVDFVDWKTLSENYIPILGSTSKIGIDYFRDIVKTNVDNQKKFTKCITIHYLKQKDSLLLNDLDSINFKNNADYNDYYSKLSGILNEYDNLSEKVEMRKRYLQSPVLAYLSELKLDKLEIYNVTACCIPNILLVFSYPGNLVSYIIFYWELVLIFLLLAVISNFMIFKGIKTKYITKNEKTTIKDYITPITEKEILPFLWSFICGILGLCFNFFYPLQLFTIFKISDTMSNVFGSIQKKYKQFLSTAFLLVILISFYAALTIYFFSMKDDGSYLCQSYLECFFYLFNYGLRAGGVPFDPKISDQPGFWSEFLYSWVFYFLIILIILNIVNGIIVDTFQELREESNSISEAKENSCFICQISRSAFESKGLDFEYHINYEHSVHFYFCYLFKVKKTDPHDLNAVNFQVFNAIKANKVEFFPIEKANGLTDDNN